MILINHFKVYMDFLLRDWSLDEGAYSNVSYFSIYSSLSLTVLALSCSANIIGQVRITQPYLHILAKQCRKYLNNQLPNTN